MKLKLNKNFMILVVNFKFLKIKNTKTIKKFKNNLLKIIWVNFKNNKLKIICFIKKNNL